jgi:hypothetical protein
MYGGLLGILAEVRDGQEYALERWPVNRMGFDRSGRYFGSLERGERMYAISTSWGRYWVRTRATAPQLRNALDGALAIGRALSNLPGGA